MDLDNLLGHLLKGQVTALDVEKVALSAIATSTNPTVTRFAPLISHTILKASGSVSREEATIEGLFDGNPSLTAIMGITRAIDDISPERRASSGVVVPAMFSYYLTLITPLSTEQWAGLDMERALLAQAPTVFGLPVGSATLGSMMGRLHSSAVTRFGTKEKAVSQLRTLV